MSRTNVQRVRLGAPYNIEVWWNTARRIINEKHRGQFDYRFIRHQPLPDAAGLHKSNSAYIVGTGPAGSVSLKEVLNYKRTVGTKNNA